MHRIRIAIKVTIVVLICFVIATEDKNAFTHIESATAGIIGTILGGMTAGISIIFGILSTLGDKLPVLSTNADKFRSFLKNLKSDLLILIWCLVFSVLLPYLRVVGIPFINLPSYDFMPNRDVLYTTFELVVITIAILTIREVISVMFSVFELSLKSENKEE
jgi:hypothetical protein